MTHRLDPSQYLSPGETLLWQGRPQPSAKTPMAIKIIKAAGWVMLICFVFFGLMAWANRAEMAGNWGIMGTFLALSGLLAVVFLIGYPRLATAALRNTRYGVTSTHAIIVRGVWRTELLRYPVGKKATIEARGNTAVFGSWIETRDRNQDGVNEQKALSIGFTGLSLDEAQAAVDALKQIKGVSSGKMTITANPARSAA